jgi:hypothetical protein
MSSDELIEELRRSGFRFSVILAESRDGDSGPFISAVHRLGLRSVVAIRSNHGVWMRPDAAGCGRMRPDAAGCCPASAPAAPAAPAARPFERVFTDGASQERFIRETIFGTRRTVRSFQITTDP